MLSEDRVRQIVREEIAGRDSAVVTVLDPDKFDKECERRPAFSYKPRKKGKGRRAS